MENNGRVCPICDKLFSNGKALGGHIRSHLAKLPVPPKPSINSQVVEYSTKTSNHSAHFKSLSSSPTANARSDPIRNLRSSFYPKIPTGKRSKRKRKQFIVAEGKENITQFNETEENAENTQSRFVYNNSDIDAMGTLFIMNRKEWQQIKKKYYSEEVGRSGNKDDVANGEMHM
ncbi:zinc finger protein ZAT9 [Trifolium repens]|nr:zinc finger protein ZAT9 [Trifolium repens]